MDISLGEVQDTYFIISWATLKSNMSFPYVILSSLVMGIDLDYICSHRYKRVGVVLQFSYHFYI